MYSTVLETEKVKVDFIYEPPQQGTEENLSILQDPDEEKLVEAINKTQSEWMSENDLFMVEYKRIFVYNYLFCIYIYISN